MSVEAKHVSVSFSGVKALNDVSIHIDDGSICGILGANGSGKSTLIKVLTGIYHPDPGSECEIVINGMSCKDIVDSNQANEMGVRVVYQESPLIAGFTVAECIAAVKGYPKKSSNGIKIPGLIDWNKIYEYAKELLMAYDIDILPDQMIRDLSAAQRNMLAIAIAIGKEDEQEQTSLLILDESEASIPENEAEFFLDKVRAVAKKGIPIIMISHRLKSVLKYCDTVAILNNGELVFDGNVEDINEEIIVEQMLKKGKNEEETEQKENVNLANIWSMLKCRTCYNPGKQIMKIDQLGFRKLKDCSFELYAGDILGIVGVADSGILEIPWLLSGAWNRKCGSIIIDDEEFPKHMNTKKAIQRGVVLLPCDRPKYGGVMECSARENIFMPNEKRFWGRKRFGEKILQALQEVFDIQPYDSFEKPFGTFSGGNQQKVIMAKWMSLKPKVFIMDDPTYGVDPGSRQRMFMLMKEAANQGMGIVVFSTEPEQLADICTRIIVIRDGRAAGELQKKDGVLEREKIARWSYL